MSKRIKQTRQLCKENAKLMHKSTLEEKVKLLDIVKDTVIVHKIEEKKTDLKILNNMEDENIIDAIDALNEAEDLEEKQVAEEYETIVTKQLQMLQADERGRQALQNEVTEVRRKQEKRAEALRTRAKALEIEKIRAKKISSRPPPLPKSVKSLLKEQAKKQKELTSEIMNPNLSPLQDIIEDELEDVENKENIDNIYSEIENKLKQEERDRKANKRFHEALKKDRLKQEQAEILKEIENAERLNRRQMARNISEPVGKVPCNIPDKLHYAEKQAAMEDAVENIFKRPRSTKEHAVEDLDGYEDKWEAKYKEIDSVMESKMAECVPSFVKENYSYLLQEETTHPYGKHFSGLDDSIEDLNRAYIELPPADILSNSKEIDAVISQLDQMRSELNEAYEKDFKPLLEAESAPKAVSIDKAVETDLLKVPTEDKAVEIDSSLPGKPVASSSRSVQVDIMQGGLMSYKRRDISSIKQDSGASSSEISSVKSEKYSIANSEKWAIKQPVLFPIHSKRQFEMQENSSNSFKPMTPQSYLSSPAGTYQEQMVSNDENYVSTPKNPSPKNKNISFIESARYPYHANRNIQYENTGITIVDSFRPLPLQSDASKNPSSNNTDFNEKMTQGVHDKNRTQQSKNSESNFFKPLSMQSGVSTPGNVFVKNTNISSDEKHSQYVSNKDRDQLYESSTINSFQPLSMQSDVSTPKDRSLKNKNFDLSEKNVHDTNYQKHNYENTASFQPMTPQSHLSSASNTLNSNRLNDSSVRKEISANEKQKSSKSEFVNIQNKEHGQNSNVPLQLDFGIKSTEHFLNPMEGLENDFGNDFYMQELSKEDLLRCDPSVRHKYLLASKKRDAKTVKVPSSGFVPHLTPADFTSFKGDRMDSTKRNISAITEKVAEKNMAASVPPAVPALLINCSQNTNDSKITLLDMNSIGKVDGSPSGNFVGLPSVKSSNSILDALKQVCIFAF
ncbi:uncharacterized protein TNCT_10891 [Trichonephila clavata]|uniref:Uncharacterized protein n=1 Tax=Trichonephila clavata TaxID=2740835 RepID=A0A8X6FPI2_TRICU|nr:uncharacterized protein TNCT_10891 [Trichonephila clavata]